MCPEHANRMLAGKEAVDDLGGKRLLLARDEASMELFERPGVMRVLQCLQQPLVLLDRHDRERGTAVALQDVDIHRQTSLLWAISLARSSADIDRLSG
jgi:hypothetical protein